MEKLIDLLASGESIKVDNQLLCDVKSFNYTLQNGKVYDDSITIYNERDLLIEGNVYSSSFRVKINSLETFLFKFYYQMNTKQYGT